VNIGAAFGDMGRYHEGIDWQQKALHLLQASPQRE